jgi:hypothetical protein
MLYVTMVTVSVIYARIKFVSSAFRVFMSQVNISQCVQKYNIALEHLH